MAKRPIVQVEDAILAALAPLAASHKVHAIEPYNGELDPDKFVAAVQQWPAVLAHYTGSTVEDRGQRRAEYLEFVVFCCDRHETDQSQARRGGPTNPGTYALLDGVADRLEGRRVIASDDVFPCVRGVQQSEIQGRAVSVYSARYVIETVYLVPME